MSIDRTLPKLSGIRGLALFAAVLLAALAGLLPAAPVVSNITASQRPGTGLVDISYDLSGGAGPMTVSVSVSSDNGATWAVVPGWGTLTGDAGPGVANGAGKRIVWDAGRDRPGVKWAQTGVKVIATEAGATGQTVTIYLPGNVPLDLVRIPAGTFQMGRYLGEQDSNSSEDPRHQVTIGQAFYLGKYEVTKAQWQAVMGTTPWSGQSEVLNDPNSPAVYVSWNDIAGAGGFIEKLNQHLSNTDQGSGARLPSEAEWEYACRAGTTTRFYWGDDPSYTQIGDYAWYQGNVVWTDEWYAHVVGLKLPNAWGLYDMSGNVWEWCQDYWHSNYTGAPADGSAWLSPPSSGRVLRGGHWFYLADRCRAARRTLSPTPDNRGDTLGLRLVRTQ